MTFDFTVIVPVYNGGKLWLECIESILTQSKKPRKVVVIDSSSTDASAMMAAEAGFVVTTIEKSEFDHGGTRTAALDQVVGDFVVFMTQDAVLNDIFAFEKILSVFERREISAAYGRQLPHSDANPLAVFARKSSYGDKSYVTTLRDEYPRGFKKAFMSNSFSAYRVEDLKVLGAFPSKLILGEDSYFAAKALLAGKAVAYVADATVRHSHNYNLLAEFRRYFDIGVFHSDQCWMIDELGAVEGEGVKFAVQQVGYLIKSQRLQWVPASLSASFLKFLGYRLGRLNGFLPVSWSRFFSMHKAYFSNS